MQTRTHSHAAAFGRAASARRRIRRSANRLFCNTNGCTTLMQLDAASHQAVCPICGARRLIH